MTKRTTMRDAIATHVCDGDTVCIAGFTHLMPFAATHEVIRQRKSGLTLVRNTPDLIFEQMALAGLVSKVVFGFAGNPGLGTLRLFRELVEEGSIEIEEYSHYGLVARLYAGAARLPFVPLLTGPGTDLMRVQPALRTVTSPFDGQEVPVVPPLRPDVTIVHAQRADDAGNLQVWGVLGEQRDAAFAADRVVATVEEIVPSSVVRSDPNRTIVPGFVVDAVVECPWGAHPSNVQGHYDRDNAFYIDWHRISADRDRARAWLDEWVYDVPERSAYLAKLGGDHLQGLRGRTRYATPVDYGEYL